jgi:hypothetical protein
VSSKRRSRNIQDDMQQSLSTPGDDCPWQRINSHVWRRCNFFFWR